MYRIVIKFGYKISRNLTFIINKNRFKNKNISCTIIYIESGKPALAFNRFECLEDRYRKIRFDTPHVQPLCKKVYCHFPPIKSISY